MAAAAIIAAVVGAVGGGVIRGVTTAKQNQKLAGAYREAAKKVREAAEKYSGENLYQGMRTAGDDMAYRQAMASEQPYNQPTNPGQTNNAMGIANQAALTAAGNANAAGVAGREQGMAIEKGKKDALYNAETVAAQQMMKQAGIDYNVANQAAQAGANAVAGTAKLVGQLK